MSMMIDDRDDIPAFSPTCTFCRHGRSSRDCVAFPAGIPMDIWKGDDDHRNPREGDHGIQFEAKTRVLTPAA